jgi:hypothetical protein
MKQEPMRDAVLFDRAVAKFFKPIADKLQLPLFKVAYNIYEIPSPYFIMRIRLHGGRYRGINVILRRTTLRDFVDNKPGFQLGIGCFAQFIGEELKGFKQLLPTATDADFMEQAQLFMVQAERFGVPYLLGLKDDFEAVEKFIVKRGEPEVQRIKEMTASTLRNMRGQVRAEWPVIIPREKGEEGETVKELRASNIQFLGELEGQKEKIFKEKLAEFFTRDRSVKSAYLARIIGKDIPATTALCLRTQFGADRGMMEKIGKIFAPIFGIDENFNIIFLTDPQESLLAKVCRPFFASQ